MSQSSSSDEIKAKLRNLPSLKGPFREFDPGSFPSTPHTAFQIWLDDAIAEGIQEPHAMTLSTTDEHGRPDARVLLLKNIDERGWHFAASGASAKGRQIAQNADVALTFYWPALGRQVRLRGSAERLSDEECADDFRARGDGAKAAAVAVAARQSRVLEEPGELRKGLEEAEVLLRGSPDYVAPDWNVYAVAPRTVEFWQGATDRVHQRLEFVLDAEDGSWSKRLLWP